ncbi:restriction endonuclease [Kitasatospora cineracea]|uniref:restriction endonuclease n=1 Tax=Kitasatospora cineracea TaxID=88074 RepID=UPI003795FDCC
MGDQNAPYADFLPKALGILRRIDQRASAPAPPHRANVHDLSEMIAAAFSVIEATHAHLKRVRREATPVMVAGAECLDLRRDFVGYWLKKTETKLIEQRAALAAAENAYWQRAETVRRQGGTDPFAVSPHDVEAVGPIRADIALRTKDLADVLEKEPTALFCPMDTFPVALVKEIRESASFERLVSTLMRRDGFQIARSQGHSGDNGADTLATWPIGQKFMVQAKHTRINKAVVPEAVRAAPASFVLHEVDVVVVVTNGKYSRSTRENARKLNVHLVDGPDLQRWLEHGESLVRILTDNQSAGPLGSGATRR